MVSVSEKPMEGQPSLPGFTCPWCKKQGAYVSPLSSRKGVCHACYLKTGPEAAPADLVAGAMLREGVKLPEMPSSPCERCLETYAEPNSLLCVECRADMERLEQKARLDKETDGRQARVLIDHPRLGTLYRYAPGKWVKGDDIRGVCLEEAADGFSRRLVLKTATCGKIDVLQEPWLSDLIAELGVAL